MGFGALGFRAASLKPKPLSPKPPNPKPQAPKVQDIGPWYGSMGAFCGQWGDDKYLLPRLVAV